MAKLLIQRAVTGGSRDEEIKTGKDQQPFQCHAEHRRRGKKKNDTSRDRSQPNNDSPDAFCAADIYPPPG